MADLLDAYEAGEKSVEKAAKMMLEEMRLAGWLPKHIYDWGSKQAQHGDFSNPELVGKLIEWGKADSPTHLREDLFDFTVPKRA